jgi:hypothetical protein
MPMPLDLPVPYGPDALATTLVAFRPDALGQSDARAEVLALRRMAIAGAEHALEPARTLDELACGGSRLALVRLPAAAQTGGLLGSSEAEAMGETFLSLLLTGALLMRLLLGVAEAPDVSKSERRGCVATEQMSRMYATSSPATWERVA